MLGVYDSMKKLIDKCDLYFEGHIISKELLIKNYADFLASNFEKKHNVAISLHTGSVCFDIITVLFAAISNIMYNQDNAEDYVLSLNVGDMVLYKKTRCKFEGITILQGETQRRAILYSENKRQGRVEGCKNFVSEDWWNKISPYNGDATNLDARGIRTDNKKRNDFLATVFEMSADEIPAFIKKSSVIVMNRDRSERIIGNLEICYDSKRIKIIEIMPVSYCSENEEYPYGGNPGKIEPAIKITNSISNARSIVTGTWQGNKVWNNDVVGVSIIGFSAVSRARAEVSEMMKRRKLKYVFVSFNISSEDGETLLDEVDDASVFACTTEYLLNSSFPIVEENPYTLELDKQVASVINHETIPLPVKTFDCDWNMYKKVQIALARLRHSGYKEAEDFVPLAYSVMNLMITSVFPFQLMETLVESGNLEVESPFQRILRLTDMIAAFSGESKDAAKSILEFLEDGYTKLLTYSPKEQALFDLLSKFRNQKVAIIVPKAYYADILHSLNVLDYFEDATQLYISTANKFDYAQQYDVIVAIGAFWGKKFDPFRSRAASAIYVIVSAVEENIFKYRKKLADTIERKFNKCAKVPVEYNADTAETYSDDATDEEISEVINSASNVTEYINKIFETKALDLLNNTSSAHYSTTEISHIATCADGENVFFTKKYRAYVFDSVKEDVIEVSVDKLSPGDTVIFKSNNSETKDIVTALLDTYIDEYRTTSEDIQIAYLKARYWKEVLRKYRTDNNLSFKELSRQMEIYGSKKHEVTIQSWLAEDSYIVGPQDIEAYVAIAEMTHDADMLADPKSFCVACEKIRSIRVGILKLIAKTIISKYSGKLSAEDDMAKVVSENIDNISTLVQIETISPATDKKAPINMVNRPITIS